MLISFSMYISRSSTSRVGLSLCLGSMMAFDLVVGYFNPVDNIASSPSNRQNEDSQYLFVEYQKECQVCLD